MAEPSGEKTLLEVDTSQLYIWDSQRKHRLAIGDSHSAKSLVAKMGHEWIGYLECDADCGRLKHCRFPQKNPDRPGRYRDIQCGIAMTALENFVSFTFDSFANAPILEKKQAYLDVAYFFTRFVYYAELRVGKFLDPDFLRYFGDKAMLAVDDVVCLREELDGLARNLQFLSDSKAYHQVVILVEGSTEKTFLEGMRRSGLAMFLYHEVQSYDGSNNRRPNRLQMLLNRYQSDGYKVCIQGDADGRGEKPFQALCEKTDLPEDCTFFFKYDFETSLPPELLFQGLYKLGVVSESTDMAVFCSGVKSNSGSVSKYLTQRGIDLDPVKVDLADVCASLISRNHLCWWMDEVIMNSELGRFLEFVQSA